MQNYGPRGRSEGHKGLLSGIVTDEVWPVGFQNCLKLMTFPPFFLFFPPLWDVNVNNYYPVFPIIVFGST